MTNISDLVYGGDRTKHVETLIIRGIELVTPINSITEETIKKATVSSLLVNSTMCIKYSEDYTIDIHTLLVTNLKTPSNYGDIEDAMNKGFVFDCFSAPLDNDPTRNIALTIYNQDIVEELKATNEDFGGDAFSFTAPSENVTVCIIQDPEIAIAGLETIQDIFHPINGKFTTEEFKAELKAEFLNRLKNFKELQPYV